MFGRDEYTLLMQLLDPKIRYMGDNMGLLGLDDLRDIYALSIHNIKLPRGRYENQFLIYLLPEFHIGDKVLFRDLVRDVCDPKYDVAYHVVHVIGWQLELMDKSGKIHKVND